MSILGHCHVWTHLSSCGCVKDVRLSTQGNLAECDEVNRTNIMGTTQHSKSTFRKETCQRGH